MPNLVYDTPTPPSQLYSSSAAIAGSSYPSSSLRPRSQQQQFTQPAVTSTVLPKSRLRQQYRPEMDYDLDTSSSDSTFSSTDLAADNNNNSPRNKQLGVAAEADENQAPNGYYRSPGYGDAGMGAGLNDKQRFLDVRQPSRPQQQQRGTYLSTRVDEHSDATIDSSNQSTASDSDDDIALRSRPDPRQHQQQSTKPNKTNNLTSTPYPGPGVSSNNISKSAFDGMARELRKEFDRIMHAGQEPARNDNVSLAAPVLSNPSPPHFRSRHKSAIHRESIPTSPSYVQDNPTPLPRGVQPRRPASANGTRTVDRDQERTPTTQRTFGQEIRYPRQASPAQPAPNYQPRVSPPKPILAQQKPSWQSYQPTSPFHAPQITSRPGIVPPNNTRASHSSTYRAAESPSRASVASSSYQAVRVPDITGLTDGLTSPSRAESGPSSHRNFATSSGSPVSAARSFRTTQEDPALSSALSGLRRRLEALESENARSEAKVAELQDRLVSRDLPEQHAPILNGETDANDLVQRLRGEINNLQQQIESHNHTLSQLQAQQPQSAYPGTFAEYNANSWQNVFASLREALHHLADQVMQVRKVLEEVLEGMKNYSPISNRDANLLRPRVDTAREHVVATEPMMQTRYPSTLSRQPGGVQEVQISDNNAAQQPIRLSPPMRSTSAPVPQAYNAEFRVPRNTSNPLPVPTMHASAHNREPLLDRAERILSSLPPRSSAHAPATCDTCRRQLDGSPVNRSSTFLSRASFDDSHAGRKTAPMEQELPMQTVVTRALRDLEEDFAVHRRIYIDLSEEFKTMDPATPEVNRRKVLASHLKESIDVLEMKADEIKRLYDLLHYRSEMQTATEFEKMRSVARAMKSRFG